MKKRHYGLFVLLAIGFLSEACKKNVNAFSANAYVDGDIIKDEQTAEAVLTGVYYRLANAAVNSSGGGMTRWTDINEYFPSELAGSLTNVFDPYDSISRLTFSPAFGAVDSIWVYGYNLVNAANGFIKNATPVNNIPASGKGKMMAEARFLRAFGNAELLFYFGRYREPSSKYGIILRDTFVTVGTMNLSRSNVASAYASILSDLDFAMDGLPVRNSAIYYANASDAKLLKARVLINRGQAGDYAEVIDLTNDIITNGPFALEDSVKDIFLTKGFGSSEVMLGIQPYPNQRYKTNAAEWGETDFFTGLMAGDARSKWVYYINSVWFSFPFNQMTKYYAGKNPTNPKVTPLGESCYAMRLSEAFLLEAEAIVLSGGDAGRSRLLLKTVMSHAGAGVAEMAAVDAAVTPEALQLEIVREYLRSFIFENGVDWLALRRLPFSTIRGLNPNIKDPNRLVLPIPAAELIYNNVIQNPGY